MRILFVNYEYPPLGGGGGVVNAWLAEELAKRHTVTVLTSGAFDLREREVARDVEIVRTRTFFRRQMAVANMPSMATFILRGPGAARRLAQGREFDVVNTHFALPTGPVGASVSRAQDIPNVLSVHGGDLYDPTKWLSPHRHALLRSVVRYIVRCADAVVGQSNNTNDNLRRYYDGSMQPHLIPLGIPKPGQATAGRESLGLPAGEFVMATVGRLVARKGTDQLITMLAVLRDLGIRLVVIGDGPELENLRHQADEQGVADRVLFTGFVSEQEKVNLLAAADIYVSASQHEGFGLVFLEAMAQGLPIVCYEHGGQSDFLTDGVNGFLLPLNDLEGFGEAVRRLVQDATKRNEIAGRNRREVEHFYIENCARRYEDLFHDVVARRADVQVPHPRAANRIQRS